MNQALENVILTLDTVGEMLCVCTWSKSHFLSYFIKFLYQHTALSVLCP